MKAATSEEESNESDYIQSFSEEEVLEKNGSEKSLEP